MTDTEENKILKLMGKGVQFPDPESVLIGDEVSIDRIDGDRVVIYPGTRIRGASTTILRGSRIGEEAPTTIDNCWIGPYVHLRGGYHAGSVFLKGVRVGSGAHIRPGTIMEDESSAAHTVGLKQTILFPYVTLGSLINFCDITMTGGTGRKNHSEVGSSYIHFNFTPNQDKATASLLGDVPDGVLLDQPPIFLGGQGGLVGPARLAFGTVIAAGSIYRKDEFKPGRLLAAASSSRAVNTAYTPGSYPSIRRIVDNNFYYLANLAALNQWYRHVRRLFVGPDFTEALWSGLTESLSFTCEARVRQLGKFAEKMERSVEILQRAAKSETPTKQIAQQMQLQERWPEIAAQIDHLLSHRGHIGERDAFLGTIFGRLQAVGHHYTDVIHSLSDEEKSSGKKWLRSIVDHVYGHLKASLPALFD